jgi:hypothetical protein
LNVSSNDGRFRKLHRASIAAGYSCGRPIATGNAGCRAIAAGYASGGAIAAGNASRNAVAARNSSSRPIAAGNASRNAVAARNSSSRPIAAGNAGCRAIAAGYASGGAIAAGNASRNAVAARNSSSRPIAAGDTSYPHSCTTRDRDSHCLHSCLSAGSQHNTARLWLNACDSDKIPFTRSRSPWLRHRSGVVNVAIAN